jgi:hypothetical protein
MIALHTPAPAMLTLEVQADGVRVILTAACTSDWSTVPNGATKSHALAGVPVPELPELALKETVLLANVPELVFHCGA